MTFIGFPFTGRKKSCAWLQLLSLIFNNKLTVSKKMVLLGYPNENIKFDGLFLSVSLGLHIISFIFEIS